MLDVFSPSRVHIVTDSTVGPLYLDKLASQFDLPVSSTVIPAGEAYKRLTTVETIYHDLLKAGIDPQGPRHRPGRRRDRRHRRLCRGDLPARRAALPDSDHPARAGRFLGRRQDRRGPARGQEPGRRVLSAPPGAHRPRRAGHAAPRNVHRRHGRGRQVRLHRGRRDFRHGRPAQLPRQDRGHHLPPASRSSATSWPRTSATPACA